MPICKKSKKTLERYLKNDHRPKILHCRIPSSVLLAYLEDNIFESLSSILDSGINLNLDYIDKHLEAGKELVKRYPFEKEWLPTDFYTVRRLLKLGLVTKELTTNGQLNPVQLIIGTTQGKYIIHPGVVRTIVMLGVLDFKEIDVMYVWDKCLDPDPFVLDYIVDEIETVEYFYKIHKHQEFDIFQQTITHSTTPNNCHSELQVTALQKRLLGTEYQYNFLCTMDFWSKTVEQHVIFKDVLEYQSNTECTLYGHKFIKEQNYWKLISLVEPASNS